MENFKKVNLKIILIGDIYSGKTSLSYQCVFGQMTDPYPSNIGAAFITKKYTIENREIVLEIWDPHGRERYKTIAPMYYRNVHCCLLCFDVNSKYSFESLDSWKKDYLKNYVNSISSSSNDNDNDNDSYPPIIIVGNKIDSDETRDGTKIERVISKEEALSWCKNNGNLLYFETSSKLGINVEQLFINAGKKGLDYYDKIKKNQILPPSPSTNLDNNSNSKYDQNQNQSKCW